MTIIPITAAAVAVCSCGNAARTDNDSGVCHQWPVCGMDEIIPRARTRWDS